MEKLRKVKCAIIEEDCYFHGFFIKSSASFGETIYETIAIIEVEYNGRGEIKEVPASSIRFKRYYGLESGVA